MGNPEPRKPKLKLSKAFGFRVLGFWVLGFRVLGFRGLGLGFLKVGFQAFGVECWARTQKSVHRLRRLRLTCNNLDPNLTAPL